MQSSAPSPTLGPLARTARELEYLTRVAAFRRERRYRSRSLLHQSDALLELVEECRVRGYRLVPTPVWAEIVKLVGAVTSALRDELGIDRHPDHVAEVLFEAQDQLMVRSRDERRPMRAEIIPLFAPPAGVAADAV
ncbi:MAG: hypothetical protein NVSMB29_03700 [Candidatus Dormibacteria bacterium]